MNLVCYVFFQISNTYSVYYSKCTGSTLEWFNSEIYYIPLYDGRKETFNKWALQKWTGFTILWLQRIQAVMQFCPWRRLVRKKSTSRTRYEKTAKKPHSTLPWDTERVGTYTRIRPNLWNGRSEKCILEKTSNKYNVKYIS